VRVERIVDDEVVPVEIVAEIKKAVEHEGIFPKLSWRYDEKRGPIFKSKYDKLIVEAAKKFDVDAALVSAVIKAESDFNPREVSNKGARGLMQLMPETARQYGVRNVFDPEDNIRGGIHNLADLLARYRGDLRQVLAAYNAGDGAVAKYRGIPPYEETMTYVKRALTVYYGTPYGQATSFAGRRGGRKLTGGFGAATQPLVAMLPGMRYLGTR